MEVCFFASGERVARFDAADFEGKTCKAVKQALTDEIGISRFRQRLFLENGAREIPDDEVFASVPEKIQLVVLAFCPSTEEEEEDMMWAASENDTAGLEELLKRPLNPEATYDEYGDEWEFPDQYGEVVRSMTALHYAAEYGHVEPMKLLLEARAEINAGALGMCGNGMAPLHLAACRGHLEAVRFLVETGAQKDQTDIAHKTTTLKWAALFRHFDVARFLIQVGANKDLSFSGFDDTLLCAAMIGNQEMARFGVEAGMDTERADNCGLRPLHIAAANGNSEMVRFLVESGASRNSTTNAGKTALDLASEHGRADVVHLLSELDADSPRRKVPSVASDRPEE